MASASDCPRLLIGLTISNVAFFTVMFASICVCLNYYEIFVILHHHKYMIILFIKAFGGRNYLAVLASARMLTIKRCSGIVHILSPLIRTFRSSFKNNYFGKNTKTQYYNNFFKARTRINGTSKFWKLNDQVKKNNMLTGGRVYFIPFFLVFHPVFGTRIGARLYSDLHCVGPHLGGSAPYPRFFYTWRSNSKPLIKKKIISSTVPYPLAVILYLTFIIV